MKNIIYQVLRVVLIGTVVLFSIFWGWFIIILSPILVILIGPLVYFIYRYSKPIVDMSFDAHLLLTKMQNGFLDFKNNKKVFFKVQHDKFIWFKQIDSSDKPVKSLAFCLYNNGKKGKSITFAIFILKHKVSRFYIYLKN